jgi:hypothetical protein
VEALRAVFLHDALARLGPEADVGGLWDRQGTRWIVFELDGTRQAARQRALPASALIGHHRSGVYRRCVHPATWDASVGRWFAPVPRSGPRPYPSVALHVWSSGQCRLPRRVVTGTRRDRCVSDRAGSSPKPGPRSTRWFVWEWGYHRGFDRRRSLFRDALQRLCEARN